MVNSEVTGCKVMGGFGHWVCFVCPVRDELASGSNLKIGGNVSKSDFTKKIWLSNLDFQLLSKIGKSGKMSLHHTGQGSAAA